MEPNAAPNESSDASQLYAGGASLRVFRRVLLYTIQVDSSKRSEGAHVGGEKDPRTSFNSVLQRCAVTLPLSTLCRMELVCQARLIKTNFDSNISTVRTVLW